MGRERCLALRLCVLFTLLGFVVFSPMLQEKAYCQEKVAKERLEDGISSFEKGKSDRAIDEINEALGALTDKKDLSRAYFYLARAHYQEEKIEECRENFEQFIKLTAGKDVKMVTQLQGEEKQVYNNIRENLIFLTSFQISPGKCCPLGERKNRIVFKVGFPQKVQGDLSILTQSGEEVFRGLQKSPSDIWKIAFDCRDKYAREKIVEPKDYICSISTTGSGTQQPLSEERMVRISVDKGYEALLNELANKRTAPTLKRLPLLDETLAKPVYKKGQKVTINRGNITWSLLFAGLAYGLNDRRESGDLDEDEEDYYKYGTGACGVFSITSLIRAFGKEDGMIRDRETERINKKILAEQIRSRREVEKENARKEKESEIELRRLENIQKKIKNTVVTVVEIKK